MPYQTFQVLKTWKVSHQSPPDVPIFPEKRNLPSSDGRTAMPYQTFQVFKTWKVWYPPLRFDT